VTSPAEDEVDLVRRCGSPGPERAAAERELCSRYSARVTRYAERHLRDPGAARDLAQLVLLSVIEALRGRRIEDPTRLGAFVLSTCRYLVWDENRAVARQQKLGEALGAIEEPLVSEPLTNLFDRPRLEACLHALPARDQRVVLLSYCEEWSAEQIASELETTAGNVRVVRHRALGRLAQCLEERRATGAER
jgi:RNA polymerase sigma factor (sigma-70 family)